MTFIVQPSLGGVTVIPPATASASKLWMGNHFVDIVLIEVDATRTLQDVFASNLCNVNRGLSSLVKSSLVAHTHTHSGGEKEATEDAGYQLSAIVLPDESRHSQHNMLLTGHRTVQLAARVSLNKLYSENDD